MKKLLLALLFLTSAPSFATEKIKWQPWTDDIFHKAKAQKKFVILDLEAVWCHWCHVMEEVTYADEKVQDLINKNYLPVRVDQDSRPDLSNRYEDFGWPATVIFNSNGQELAIRSGYIPPDQMASLLKAVVDDPTPGPSVVAAPKIEYQSTGKISVDVQRILLDDFNNTFDSLKGGWTQDHKFLDPDSVEYAMMLAAAGDPRPGIMAQKTLDANLKLIDPAWGGIYQYSVGGDWNQPHFEKIMYFQANNIRIYSMAYSLWRRSTDLKAATDIARFLTTFLLSPSGAFYTSQDADLVKGDAAEEYFRLFDAERRKRGIPTIDKHIYSRENGWAIEALAALYSVTGDEEYLTRAKVAASWIAANRAGKQGGFRHDEIDKAGPYLGDTLAMGRAFLALYEVTSDRAWLVKSRAAADWIEKTFKTANGGYATSVSPTAGFKPMPQRDENVALARFANLLYHYTGKGGYRDTAEYAMRYLAAPTIAQKRPTAAALLTDWELANDPLHITVIGNRKDALALKLYRTASLAFPFSYKRVEWWDNAEGALMNSDVEFPKMKDPAAFVCVNRKCSLPITLPEKLEERLKRP